MKVFENKSLLKKLVIILLFIIIFSFCIPRPVKAYDMGKLMDPVMSLFVGLGDGAMSLLQKVVFHIDNSVVEIDSSSSMWAKVIVIVGGILAVSAIVIATVLTAGAAAGVVATILAVSKGVLTVALTIGALTITYPVTTTLIEGVLPEDLILPLYEVTPQEIFSNKIPLLDVNFFSTDDGSITLKDGTVLESTATKLKPTIANWYVVLRNISIVALLSILVYIGIRIIISSTSSDKAKYKQMLIDWIVAICLLFVMQYIMSFSNLVVDKIIDIVDSTKVDVDEENKQTQPELFIISDKKVVDKAYEVLVSKPTEKGDYSSESEATYYNFFKQASFDGDGNVGSIGESVGKNSNVLCWPAENFMQQARIELQLLDDNQPTFISVGWKLIYVVLVVYTFIFMFTYIKRVVYMAFLTIIAPLVAMTYPIDKINDGKAQAFNMWLKEYIFNLLIQPMHLIMYTILVQSAMDFASKNIIYVIVALGFMVPAEKLLRKFFGFEKAHTPGLLAGPAGAAVMMSGINKMLGKGSKGGQKSVGSGSSSSTNDTTGKPPRVNTEFDSAQALFGAPNSSEENGQHGGQQNVGSQYQYTNMPLGQEQGQEHNQEQTQDQGNWDAFYANTGSNGRLGETGNYEQGEGYWDAFYANNNLDGGRQAKQQIDNGFDGNYINDDEDVRNFVDMPNNENVQPIRKQWPGTEPNSPDLNKEIPRVNNDKKKIKKKSALRGIGTASRYIARTNANKLKNKFENSHPLRTTAKLASGVAGAAVMGTAGAIAGIASGDINKGIQYATAGAVGGYKMTNNIPDRMTSIIPEGVDEAFKSGYYQSDDERKKVEQEKYRKEYQHNEKNMLALEQKYGRKEAKKIMKDHVPQMLDNGITDIQDIIAIENLVRDKDVTSVNSIEQGVAIKKYAGRLGSNTKNMKQDDKDKWKNTFSKEFGQKGYTANERMADDVMKGIEAFNKERY